MSGHNKWSKIKHTKEASDKKKGALYSKYLKEITVAARAGADPQHNARLRQIIDDARSQSVPKDNIERAIKRGSGELSEGAQLEELTYEGFGPGGVALLIGCVTDNRLRTQPEIKKIFEKFNGRIAEKGAVSWGFVTKGQILIAKESADPNTLMNIVLEAGAEDIHTSEEGCEIITSPEQFDSVCEALKTEKIPTVLAEVGPSATHKTMARGEEAKLLQNLIEALEDHEDVQRVSTNAEIT